MYSITPSYGNEGLPKNITFECNMLDTDKKMKSACTGLYTIKTIDNSTLNKIDAYSLPDTPNVKIESAGKIDGNYLTYNASNAVINNLDIKCKELYTSNTIAKDAKVYNLNNSMSVVSGATLSGNDALYGVDPKYDAKWCIASVMPNLESLSINLTDDIVDKTIIVPESLKSLKYHSNRIHNVEFLTGMTDKFEPTSNFMEDTFFPDCTKSGIGWVYYLNSNKEKLDRIALNGWSTSGKKDILGISYACFGDLRINGWNGGLKIMHKLDTLKVDNANFDLYLSSADEFIVPNIRNINVVNGENASGVKSLYKNENHDLYDRNFRLKIDISKPNQFNNVDLSNFGISSVGDIYFEDENANHIPSDNMFNDCVFPDKVINYITNYSGENAQNNIFNRCSGALSIGLKIKNGKLGNNCCSSNISIFANQLAKLKEIGDNCFNNCKTLPESSFTNGAKIGKNAFNNIIEGTSTIGLPDVDADIDGFMYNCPNVTSVSGVTLHYSGTSNLDWVRGPFQNCNKLKTVGSATYPLKLYSKSVNMESTSMIDESKRWFKNSNNINTIYFDEPNASNASISKMFIHRTFVDADSLPQNGTAHIPDIASLSSVSLLNYLSGWRGWTLVRDL